MVTSMRTAEQITNKGRLIETVATALYVLGIAATMFDMISYVGLYRFATDLMLNNFGISIRLIGLIGCIPYFLPAVIFSRVFWKETHEYQSLLLDAETAAYDKADSYAALELPKVTKSQRQLGKAAIILSAAALLAFGGTFLASEPSLPTFTMSADSREQFPETAQVTVTGIGQPLSSARLSIGASRFVDVIPLPQSMTAGSPRLIIEFDNTNSYEGEFQRMAIERDGIFRGWIVKNGLSGEAFAMLENSGVSPTEPYWALVQNPPASARGLLKLLSVLCALCLVVVLVSFAFVTYRKRKLVADLVA
jgi:hypothetical protein